MVNNQWPSAWAGRRIIELSKNKGDKRSCDQSRGLLLMSHIGKPFCRLLADEVKPHYNPHIPIDQCGATASRGTDFATHAMLTFVERCRLLRRSHFVLFVDLVEAFDKAVREIVLCTPDNVNNVSGPALN